MKIKLYPEGVQIGRKTYYIGEKVKVVNPHGDERSAEIRFGVYDDDEGVSTQEHIGFYVRIHFPATGHVGKSYYDRSLIDIINSCVWRFVK